jgi:hypothetical protein
MMTRRLGALAVVLVLGIGACSTGPFTIEWYPTSGCSAEGTMLLLEDGGVESLGDIQYSFSSAGMPSIWCEGLIHEFEDGAQISDWTFGSESGDPLRFEVTADGYVYVGGSGSVTDPEGNVTELP